MKEKNNQNLWKFELGSQESTNVPLWNIIQLQQRDRQDSQKIHNDTFCKLPITSCQCIISVVRYRGASILLNNVDDDYN